MRPLGTCRSLASPWVEKEESQVQGHPPATMPSTDKKNTAAAVRNKMKSRKQLEVLPLTGPPSVVDWRKACADLSNDLLRNFGQKDMETHVYKVIDLVPEQYQGDLIAAAFEFETSPNNDQTPLLNQLNWLEKQPKVEKAFVSKPEQHSAVEVNLIAKAPETLQKELDRFMAPLGQHREDD